MHAKKKKNQIQRHLILEVNLGASTQILTIRLLLFVLVLIGFHVISYEFHHLLIPEVTLCQLYAAACLFLCICCDEF